MRLEIAVALAGALFPITIAAAGPAPSSGSHLGSVTGGEFREANVLIKRKCTSCHNDDRIQKALAAGKDMEMIQQRMEKKGVNLSVGEQDVLGVFWKETPLKPKK
jgi:hypothetical protein